MARKRIVEGGRRLGKTMAMKAAIADEQTRRYVEGKPALNVFYAGQKNYIDVEPFKPGLSAELQPPKRKEKKHG
jgi:hypothetical protein